MSTHTKCDRCTKEITHNHYWFETTRVDKESTPPMASMDLCPFCLESLREWAKGDDTR